MDRDAWVTPDKRAVARLDVVLNQDIEALDLLILDAGRRGSFDEVRGLQGVVRTATFSLPREVERTPGSLRAWAGPRPHARLRISCYIAEDGAASLGIASLGGGPEDVLPGEWLTLEQRALALTAAAILERLAQLEAGADA